MDTQLRGPAAMDAHFAGIPNNVTSLYVTFRKQKHGWLLGWPNQYEYMEKRMEAWGQLCFDDAAKRSADNYLRNNRKRMDGWEPHSWRCDMESEPVGGGRRSGTFA